MLGAIKGLASGGDLTVQGNYPGRARIVGELRMDVEKAFSPIPGR